MSDDLPLLPSPWRLERGAGHLALDAATPIQVAASGRTGSDHTQFAARGLQAAIADQTGLTLPITPVARPIAAPAISLVLLGRDEVSLPAAALGWEPTDDLGPQGYTLRIGEAGAVVAAADEAGLFYGAQTLIQIAKRHGRAWPALAIADRPVLPVRGLMLDVSRGKVPILDTLLRLVTTLAHYKYNQLQLYIEHTFRFPSHPAIGAAADGLSPDEVVALDAHCRAHHVELIPCFQSLGHHRALLSLPAYAHLAETSWRWSFATANEDTFRLLDELYADLLPAFSSRFFNVGADEPWDLGRGQSRALTDEIGVGGVYLRHLERLHELVGRHGRRMMMWADMFWHHPELVERLPPDIVFLDWWYQRKEHHDSVDLLAQSGRRFYVCPGTSSWSALFPRLENAIANIRQFVRDGVAAGAAGPALSAAEGMVLTDWGDGGHYQPLSNSWYPYLWGAETAWTGGATESTAFDVAFGQLFLQDGSGELTPALRRLGRAMQSRPDWLRSWHSAMALFEEPLAGRQIAVAPAEVVTEAREAATALYPLLANLPDADLRHDLGFVAAEIDFATTKVETTRAIRALLAELAAQPAPSDDGAARLTAQIATLRRQRDQLAALSDEFERRWLAHARRSEIDRNLTRFAGLHERYGVAIAWLEGERDRYLGGEGVDADLASYDVGDYAVLHDATRREILELAEIIGMAALPPDLQEYLGTGQESA